MGFRHKGGGCLKQIAQRYTKFTVVHAGCNFWYPLCYQLLDHHPDWHRPDCCLQRTSLGLTDEGALGGCLSRMQHWMGVQGCKSGGTARPATGCQFRVQQAWQPGLMGGQGVKSGSPTTPIQQLRLSALPGDICTRLQAGVLGFDGPPPTGFQGQACVQAHIAPGISH